MGAIGGVIDATNPPKTSLAKQVKNKGIAAAGANALAAYNTNTAGEQGALSDYITKYLGQQKQYETANTQEQGAIGQFYTGEMAQKLAALRGQREAAVNAAADVGVKQALANVDRSRLGSEGGGSSYDRRLAIGAVTPIRTQAALDTANQSRADLGYLTQNQLGLAGQRGQLANALAGYGLVPYQAAQGLQARDLQNLQGITNIDQANTFYGLKQDRSPWANVADALDAGILNGVSIAGSMGGGMARGGPVHGPGGPHSDSIPANLSAGEFVVPASAVRMPGVLPMLQKIRAAGLASEGRHPLGQLITMDHAGGWREPRTAYSWGGRVNYEVGGLAGGMAGAGAGMGVGGAGDGGGWDFGSMGGGSKGGGGGGGGLAAEAQYLLQREQGYLTPTWKGPAIIPQGGGWGAPTQTGTQPAARPPAGAMPRSSFNVADYMANLYGPESVPSNFDELPHHAQTEYAKGYARARGWEAEWGGPQNNPYE